MVIQFFFAAFFALGITSFGHYYLYMRLIQPLSEGLSPLWVSAFVVLWMVTFFGFAIARAVPVFLRRFVELIMFVWMGIAYLFLLLCIITAPLSLLLQARGWREDWLAWAVVIAGLLFTILAMRQAFKGETVIETVIPVRKKIHARIEDLRVVVISDVHVAGLIGYRRMRRLAKKVNELNPDLIFVTGDMVDGSVRQLSKEIEPLVEMKAKHGIYYVTGNHEYYCNPRKWKNFFKSRFNWTVLENSKVSLNIDGVKLNILGIEDRSWLRSVGHRRKFDSRLKSASEGLNEQQMAESLNILLAHQPKDARLLKGFPDIDLQVSGHTHAGQVWPLQIFVHKDQTYNKGLYPIRGSENQQIYVTQGTGFWGPPVRLGTTCEISLLRFKLTPA